ncbi:MAG: methyl-accepting chemotaxis protein [Desulfobacterales bacterium]|nr:methyl-accepting chemotaxis protein [Desulfobacterales bacterium]
MIRKKKIGSQRRIYYIKKDFQFRFIFKFCLLVLAGGLVSTGILSFFSKGTLTSTFDNSRLVIEKTSIAILPAVVYTNLITLVLITVATVAVTLLVSHKLAGPMFRFEADLKMIGEGELTKKVRLRKEDQLKDLVGSLNDMTASLHGKVADIRSHIRQARDFASETENAGAIGERLDAVLKDIDDKFIL